MTHAEIMLGRAREWVGQTNEDLSLHERTILAEQREAERRAVSESTHEEIEHDES